jgi:hypothetical protein
MNASSLMVAVPTMLSLMFALGAVSSPAIAQSDATVKAQESPFAFNRLALSPEQRKRHFDEVGPKLLALRQDVRELDNGYEFEFPADPQTVMLAAEWAAYERACCPFFDIDLRLEREGGPFWLRVTGRDGVKQFIRADGAAWVKK